MIKTAYRLQANWKITLLVVLLLPALIWLGFWQLDRADEKLVLQDTFNDRRAFQPISINEILSLDTEQLSYRRVTLKGAYQVSPLFLLDNQILFGRVGFHVLQFFQLADGGPLVLINRGWLEGLANRDLPAIPDAPDVSSVVATVYVPQGRPVLLTEDRWSNEPIRVIQSVDMDKIRELSTAPVFPYELRLEPGEYGALTADWPVVNTRVEKHLGYAFQWFAMSVVLVFCWLYASLQKTEIKSESEQ